MVVEGSAPRPCRLYPRERPSTLCTGGWVAPGPVWTDGKSRPHRYSMPDRRVHSSVAIPTELPGPRMFGTLIIHISNMKHHTFVHSFFFPDGKTWKPTPPPLPPLSDYVMCVLSVKIVIK